MQKIRILLVFTVIAIATSFAQLSAQVSTWDGTHTPWTNGTGTESNPFLIENAQQLAYLTYRVNNGLDAAGGHVSNQNYYYKLMTDIDLNGSEEFQWTPIGYYTSNSDYQCFGGHFDGNGHSVLGLYINSTLNRVGFFGYTDGATVSNLAISGTCVTTTGSMAGGLIGSDASVINIFNCSTTFSGNISATYSGSYSGGIIGSVIYANISDCSNTGNVNSNISGYDGYYGGIVGYSLATTITNCSNSGSIGGTGSIVYSGGIVGYCYYETTIINCSNTGSVSGVYNGGIVGCCNDEATITNCYNTGSVSVNTSVLGYDNYSGGIIGCGSSRIVATNCYNTGSVSSRGNGYGYSGGIMGHGPCSVTNCYNTGSLSGGSKGGIVGDGTSMVTSSYYLNNCGGNNTCGGQPLSADAMRSEEFLAMLANGSCAWAMDTEPYTNDGYPILTMILASASTYDATVITQTHATLNGGISVMNDEIVSAGFMYKRSDASNFTKITVSNYVDTMTYALSGLIPSTSYTYKTYLLTAGCDTTFGELKTFTTLPINVTTGNASNISQTHARLNGNFNLGDATGTWGFEYKKQSDTNYQRLIAEESGDVSLVATGLQPNTAYQYRAFCTPTGVSPIYGEEKTFTTLPISITTLNATNIGQTSATLNGTFDIGDVSGTWGFQYKAESDAEYQTIEVSESGNVSSPITGLTAYTVYIYRAFFSPTVGNTIYGEEKTFRTIPPWDGSYSPWTQGSGTEDNPYLIENAQQLAYLAYRVNNGLEGSNKYYKVIADIDLYGSEDFQWTPIGISGHSFSGHFDGGNHTIHGLYVNVTENNGYAGLFGSAGGTIKNTNINGSLVQGKYAGGIVGYGSSIISNCSNGCEINGTSYAGGIVGYAYRPTISNCSNTGNVSCGSTSTSLSKSGGIIEYSTSTTSIHNCYNRGSIYSEGRNDSYEYELSSYSNSIIAGGIVGEISSNSFVIANCYNTGCSSSNNYYSYGNAISGAILGYCRHFGEGYYVGLHYYDEGYYDENGWHPYTINYFCIAVNCSYLNTCNASNTYGGTATSEEAMRDANFVNLLNDNNTCVWGQDIQPFVNDGYPILTPMLYEAYTERAIHVADVSATLNGHIEVSNATITSKGFEYKKVSESEYTVVNVTTEGNTLTSHLSGLDPNTTYQYRAFVKVAECEYPAYGDNMQFTVSWLNADTIRIYDLEMLQWVADMCNSSGTNYETETAQGSTFAGKYIKLMNNIVLPLNQPNNMTSIGSYPDHPFKGTFDGNGKLITNLYIDQPNSPYQGFFGYTLNANLYNVGLVNITASGRNYTGGMVAYAENTNMRDCYVNGGTLFALSYCGGLVGYQTPGTNSIISGCYNTCTVSGNHYVGGLLGYSDQGTVRNSYVASSVAAQGEAVGAIIGGANEVLMYQCYFSSEITGQENAIGENNFKTNEGMTNDQMRDPQFVATLNQGLTVPVWKGDYEQPINSGFPILKWQYSDIETCGAPENLTSIINSNNITLIWTGEENVESYIVEYGLLGEPAETQTTPRNTISFSYETPGTYYWRVKSVCPFGESNFVNGENIVIVGIEEIGNSMPQIGLYPNPATDIVTIHADGQEISLQQINIYDVNGRIVMSEEATGESHSLNISTLQQGIYFVKIQTSDGYTSNRKLIIQ